MTTNTTRIATWNVNSLRVRLDQVLDWLANNPIDILALQETKTTDEDFPKEAIEAAGYHVAFSGQKTYNGTAIISRLPINTESLITAIPDLDDPQKRVLAAHIGPYRVINLYIPNGSDPESDKYQYKMGWLTACRAWLAQELADNPHTIVLGDFNIAPADADVFDPDEYKSIMVTPPEREHLVQMLDLGFHDSFRLFDQAPASYSWWDYRAAGFRRNRGFRIDLILASDALKNQCAGSYIDIEPRKAERPSDHTPVILELMCHNN